MDRCAADWKTMLGLAYLILCACSDNSIDLIQGRVIEGPAWSCDVDATGQSDVTSGLNTCVAMVPVGGVLHLVENGQYRVEGVLRIVDRINITIEGHGALIFAKTDGTDEIAPEDLRHLWPRQRAHIEIVGGTNITIRNLKIKGANPKAGSAPGAYVESLEGQHGFDVHGVNGLNLLDVTVSDTYGDLIYLGPRGNDWSRNVTIRRAHLERSGRQGIALTGVEDALIEDSYIGEIGRTIIDIEPFSEIGGARRVTFSRNTFGYSRHFWVSSGGRGSNVEDVVFQDNQLVGMAIKVSVAVSLASPPGARRGRHAFYRNVSNTTTGGPQPPFRFKRVDGVEVVGNVAPINERSEVGVYACDCTLINIRDNRFSGAIAQSEILDACATPSE